MRFSRGSYVCRQRRQWLPPRNRTRWMSASLFALCLLMGCGASGGPLVAILGVADAKSLPPPEQSMVLEAPRPLTNWTLPSSTGTNQSLHDFQGRFVLLFFGYTNCPDVCPTTLGEFKRVKQQLGSLASNVTFIFISVDGERDTPEVLANYVTIFDPGFIGLSGTFESLDPVASDYGLFARKPGRRDERYLVEHTAAAYLVDRTGSLRAIYGYGAPPAMITADIQRLATE